MSEARIIPQSVDAEVGRLLDEIRDEPRLPARMATISARFLGRPYVENSLGGGPDQSERLVVTLEGFDCVTYMEIVLALALSKTAQEFVDTLRNVRYEDGAVAWSSRNHYMTAWARNNEARGLIANMTGGQESAEKTRVLSVVSGLAPKEVCFRLFPKRRVVSLRKRIKTGDLILFVSTRKDLDVFHTGVLVADGEELLLRHATRAKGMVVEQRLEEFLSEHKMSGVVLLRPVARA